MPHLTLEYTANLPREIASPELFSRLHGIMAEVGGIDVGNCKSRAMGLDTYLAGDGRPGAAYVHLDVRILEGRSADVKAELGRRMLEVLSRAYGAENSNTQVTIEIRDMARAHYFKIPGPA